jgi:hypothetical protein
MSKALTHVTVPDPLPPPAPGGGAQFSYQKLFNQRYYKTRVDALKPFGYSIAASEFPNKTALTSDELTALADKLYDQTVPGEPVFGKAHIDFDEQIDYWQQDPYATMYMRNQVYGYTRVPIGTGNTTQPVEIVNPTDLVGPAIPGKYLLVTCDINLL